MDDDVDCPHFDVQLVNRHEIIRKYECTACGLVAACRCDEVFARRFLPHQIDFSTGEHSGLRVASNGFADEFCNECRGIPAESSPRAEGYRTGGKVQRYYWREIYVESTSRLDEWCVAHGQTWDSGSTEVREQAKIIRKAVIEDVKEQAARNPKYDLTEASAAEVLAAAEVDVVRYDATYVSGGDRALVLDGDESVSVELYVARRLRENGATVLMTESRPFHAMYGVLMWLWVQAPDDPERKIFGFGGRDNLDTDEHGMSWVIMPNDFGAPGHAARRGPELEEHLSFIPDETDALLYWFDIWRGHSRELCAYLWAHDDEVMDTAKQVIEILGSATIKTILRFLAEDYWGRYLGWPDLLVSEVDGSWYFAEVKSSNDRLSGDQKRWILTSHKYLDLRFKLAKVHRTATA